MRKPWFVVVLALPLVAVAGCDDKPCPDGEALVRIATRVYECESASSATKDAEAEAATMTQERYDDWYMTAGRATERADEATGCAIMEGEAAAKEQAWSKTQDAAYRTDNSNCDPNYGATHDANGYAAACVPGDRDYDCPELHAIGIGDIDVVGSDWQRLDGRFDFQSQTWTNPPDGVGCEWTGE